MIQELPHTQMIIDGKFPISPNDIFSAHLESSIWETLPKLSFKLKDTMGVKLSKLEILEGSQVEIAVIDVGKGELDENGNSTKDPAHKEEVYLESDLSKENPTENDMALLKSLYWVNPIEEIDIVPTTFLVKKLFNAFEFGKPNSGYLQIDCVHAWDLFVMNKNSAYKGKISEIIKNVLKDSSDYNGINIENIDDPTSGFLQSSDDGKVIRYSSGLCDREFIEKRLLPYLNVGKQPGYFFIDLYGKPKLLNYDYMISSAPKAFIYINKGLNDAQAEILEKELEDSDISDIAPAGSVRCSFGENENIASLLDLKQTMRMENTQGNMSELIENKAIKNENERVPFSAQNFYSIAGSKFSFNPVWSCDNDKELLKNSIFKDNEKTVLVEISINYIIKGLVPGDCIRLFSPDFSEATHWLNGNWVLAKMSIDIVKGNAGNDNGDIMTLVLMRRSIPVSESSSIEFPSLLV